MSRFRDPIERLPRVAASPSRSWWYFRSRHLPKVAVGFALPAVIGLWVINLPQPVESGRPTTISHPVANLITHPLAAHPARTNLTLADVLTSRRLDGQHNQEVFATHD